MPDFSPSNPEKEEVVLHLPKQGITISNFVEYEFNSNVLTPTDGFRFTMAGDQLTPELRVALRPGNEVQLTLNGTVQSSGYIDTFEASADRSSGVEYHIEGRDKIAQAVDSCADPTQKIPAGMTLADMLKKLFGPFGWATDDAFDIDNDANRAAKTNLLGQRITTTSSKRRSKKPRKLSNYQLHQLKPYPREGIFEFASRISQRLGLWIWPTADGKKLIVGRPDFSQAPNYKIFRKWDSGSNVLSGTVRFDNADQPTMIIADGFSGGGDFGRSPMLAIMANSFIHTDDPAFLDVIKRFPNARYITPYPFKTAVYTPRNRILYLHDPEAQTPEHLEFFIRREMALLQHRGFAANYTVEGHGQNTPYGYVPWVVDTTIDVDDDVAWFSDTLYVLGRTFMKSRGGGGTSTRLDLVRLNTLDFGGDVTDEPDASGPGTF